MLNQIFIELKTHFDMHVGLTDFKHLTTGNNFWYENELFNFDFHVWNRNHRCLQISYPGARWSPGPGDVPFDIGPPNFDELNVLPWLWSIEIAFVVCLTCEVEIFGFKSDWDTQNWTAFKHRLHLDFIISSYIQSVTKDMILIKLWSKC